jgi:hypothetical protein
LRVYPKGSKHWNWKGGIYKKKFTNGLIYYLIYRPYHKYAKRGYVLLHRYLMELMLGRYLTKKEVVHHIDHNTQNNDESNLMLFSSHKEHTAYEKKIDMSNRYCLLCGTTKTYKKYGIYEQWFNYQNGVICHTCYCKIHRGKIIICV